MSSRYFWGVVAAIWLLGVMIAGWRFWEAMWTGDDRDDEKKQS